MKKALICGVAGQDGAYLAQYLANIGYEVVGTSRDAARVDLSRLRRLGLLDKVVVETLLLTDTEGVMSLLDRHKPDEIYHLSAQSSVGVSFREPRETVNSIVGSTGHLLEALRRTSLPARFFNACSSECFGETGDTPADETTPFRPRSPYAMAKCAAFWDVGVYRESYGIHASSGILFNHESPLRPETFVTRKIISTATRIAQGSGEELVLGNLAIERDWGWAPEYMEATWRIIQQDEPGDYVLATGQSHSLAAFVEASFTALGLDWRDHTRSDPALFRPTDVGKVLANPQKAERQLGWTAKSTMRDVVRMLICDERSRRTPCLPAN